MTLRSLVVLPLLPLLSVLLMACDRPDPATTTSTHLIDDLRSKGSPEAVRAALGARAVDWNIEFTEQITPTSLEKPVEVVRVEVPAYESLGFSGRLLLTFNDKLLTRTEFCPADFEAYVRTLEAEIGVAILESGNGHQDGNTVIWAWTLEPGKECVGWRDQQLTRIFADSD